MEKNESVGNPPYEASALRHRMDMYDTAVLESRPYCRVLVSQTTAQFGVIQQLDLTTCRTLPMFLLSAMAIGFKHESSFLDRAQDYHFAEPFRDRPLVALL